MQRVLRASVTIEGECVSSIGSGLLVLVGVEVGDSADDAEWLVNKVARLRIFDDAQGVMNLDVRQAGGSILAVSQFTLLASTRRGNRPSYIRAAGEAEAVPLYELFLSRLAALSGVNVSAGVFGADMQVELVNDGPVTIWMDSRNRE